MLKKLTGDNFIIKGDRVHIFGTQVIFLLQYMHIVKHFYPVFIVCQMTPLSGNKVSMIAWALVYFPTGI